MDFDLHFGHVWDEAPVIMLEEYFVIVSLADMDQIATF